MNDTTSTSSKPELGDLLRRLIEAGIPFDLGHRPPGVRDVPAEKRFRASFMGKEGEAYSADAATALLQAAARYVRAEEKNIQEGDRVVAECRSFVSRTIEALPGVRDLPISEDVNSAGDDKVADLLFAALTGKRPPR